jgi:hypothetical protein
LFWYEAFVQTAAAWAPRKQRGRSIFELECADHAAQSITQRPAFTPAAIPLPNYPEEKNCRKEKQQINRD